MADHGEVIVRFSGVTFKYGENKPILEEADFSVRERTKLTLMGQNGAGKSTIFKLITGAVGGQAGDLTPEEGTITIKNGATVGIAKQVIPHEQRELTVEEFFASAFPKKVYNLKPKIEEILEVIHLKAPLERKVREFSGGQQARLLLAFALIQNPDILLLDEPTNNLDKAGIEHLTQFLINYPKTCIVISHDAQFLNAFTHGVLYLDVFTHKIEQYVGDYLDVVKEISARIERERMKNVRLEKDISHRKQQAGFFAQKGGHMRDVARKMREKIEELEEEVVEMRQEDKTIPHFTIPAQETVGPVLEITSVPVLHGAKPTNKKFSLALRKKQRLLVAGPNGIGKSTFLESLVNGNLPAGRQGAKGAHIAKGVIVGYYRQDFSGFDMNETCYKTLAQVMEEGSDHQLRSVAARFFITAELLKNKVGSLSEGQKGLLSFARFVLMKPGLLILDEPTNHINFRHLPVIAKALQEYEGALVLVSHSPDFVANIRIDEILDLGSL